MAVPAPPGPSTPQPDQEEVASAEAYGDLHEYGLSLGVDLEAEGEEDLTWVVQEAFSAPLPGCWTEYADDSGRAFYVREGSSASTWEHPMDEVYRELIALVRNTRSQLPLRPDSHAQREAAVREHLMAVHCRAKEELAGWSGPYPSEQGEYYHNEVQKISTWVCPVTAWENELSVRHAVLSRYLLPEAASPVATDAAGNALAAGGGAFAGQSTGEDLLRSLRLQLSNLSQKEGTAGDIPEPSTTRSSFHTARSAASSRSGRSGRTHKHSKEHKERKEKKDKSRREAQDQGPLVEFNSVD